MSVWAIFVAANWKRGGDDVRTSQFVLLSWYFISKDRGLTLKSKK